MEKKLNDKNIKSNKNNVKKDETIKKLNKEKKEITILNKELQKKIELLQDENEKIKKINTDKVLEKIDSIVSIEKYIDSINNKFVDLKNSIYYKNFFNYDYIYIKFNYRNIPLILNKRKTYGYHYCYSCHYKNYEIGINNKDFMVAKIIPNFNFYVYIYYYKKKDKVIVSIDGQIKDENNNWIYFINTKTYLNEINNDNQEFQEIECKNFKNFIWPIKHKVIFKDSMLNIIGETTVLISNEFIKNE